MVHYLHQQITSHEKRTILVEGANATMLDIDFGKLPVMWFVWKNLVEKGTGS